MRISIIISALSLIFSLNNLAQEVINPVDGIKVIVPSEKNKVKTSYFSFGGGYQLPSLVNVPMVPENSPDIIKESDMEVVIPGWFVQLGINKKTRSKFDIGLLSGYYKSSVPVALEGQSSTSDWVFDNTGSLLTEVYNEDIIRTSSVLSIRATVKYVIDIENINLWLGIGGGSYSTAIDYSYSNGSSENDTYRQTSIGVSYLAGIEILKRNSEGKDIFGVSFFGDFAGPSINEFFISLFGTGWRYDNPTGNYSINPIRIGIALNIY